MTTILQFVGITLVGFLFIAVVWGSYRIANPRPASAISASPSSTTKWTERLPSKKNIIALIAIAIIGAIIWIWWELILAFPGKSVLEQTMVLAVILFIAIATYGVWALYQKGDPVWPQRFAVAAIVGILLFGGLVWMFGEAELTGATQQDLFIGNKPNAMGWTNINGDFIVVHGITPEPCVPAGFDLFNEQGDMFPFHLTDERGSDDCYKNGIALVPNSTETTPDTSRWTPQGLVGKFTKTPAEIADKEAQSIIDSPNNRPLIVTPIPRAPEFEEVCDGFHAKALNEGRLVECHSGTLFANGEDLILPARDDACFSTNEAGLVSVEGIDVLTIDPVTGAHSDGPDGQFEAYRVYTRHGNTVTGIMVWYTKDKQTFQRYKCNKST